MSDASELRQMSDEQLALTLREAATTFFGCVSKRRPNDWTRRANCVSSARLIARVKTIQRERELATQASAKAEPKAS